MRGSIKITRVSDESAGYETEKEGKFAGWLKQFAKDQSVQAAKAAPKTDTIVEQARRRNRTQANYLDKVQNILNNKPRYATVDDAVNDMRDRTGLNEYLKHISASEQLKKKLTRVAQESTLPESLARFTRITDDIEKFIHNNIENVHALGATVPQVQQDLLETFSVRHGVQDKDVYNPEVEKYINDRIEEAQAMVNVEESNPNLGAGVGKDTNEEDENDAWSSLMPAKE